MEEANAGRTMPGFTEHRTAYRCVSGCIGRSRRSADAFRTTLLGIELLQIRADRRQELSPSLDSLLLKRGVPLGFGFAAEQLLLELFETTLRHFSHACGQHIVGSHGDTSFLSNAGVVVDRTVDSIHGDLI